MRMHRIISALLALALAAMLPLVFSSSSSAGVAAQAKKPKHDLVASGEEYKNNKFRIKGKVSTFKHKKLVIERKAGHGYKNWKKVKTNNKGKFKVRIYGGGRGSRVCYKVRVPKTKHYRKTSRKIGCIVTT